MTGANCYSSYEASVRPSRWNYTHGTCYKIKASQIMNKIPRLMFEIN